MNDEASRAYTELATAILIWDKADKGGLRADQVKAEQYLRRYAEALRDAGWKFGEDS